MTLGQRIYQYRRANGLSQEELAESLNVSRQSVSKWETDGSVPDLDKMIALSKLFGITLDELVKGEDSPALTSESICRPCPEESPLSHAADPFRRAKLITGIVLLSVSLALVLFIILFTWNVLGALSFTAPLWICGLICLILRRHTALYCGWGALLGISIYLAPQTIFSFYNFNLITSVYAYFRFDNGPYVAGISSNPLSLSIHVIFSLMVIALMALTVIFVSRDPVRVTKRTARGFCFAVAVYLLFDVAFQCLNMEMYMLLDSQNTWMNGSLYILLHDVHGILLNLRNCLRPIAFTAIATVMTSFFREKMGKRNVL